MVGALEGEKVGVWLGITVGCTVGTIEMPAADDFCEPMLIAVFADVVPAFGPEAAAVDPPTAAA